MKTCTKCKEEKPLVDFGKSKKGKYGVRSVCKPCESIYSKEYRLRDGNKEIKRAHRVKAAHNITLKEYDEIMSHPCGICGKKSEHLDHNHSTGELRGGLCSNCNRGLGHFQDDIKNLKEAIKWLEEKGSYST